MLHNLKNKWSTFNIKLFFPISCRERNSNTFHSQILLGAMKTIRKRKVDTNTTKTAASIIKTTKSNPIDSTKLDRQFFDVPCYNLANFLLGKLLVRKLDDNTILKSRIVETECYLGGEDKASHSHKGRRTPGNEPMFMQPGTAYVYMTYGMYYCFNISSTEPGAAVLLRAVEPIEGIEFMRELRMKKRKSMTAKELKDCELCNGPSKLCMSMDIGKNNCNKLDLCENDMLWVETDPNLDSFKTVVTTRIGIDSAGEEWAKKPLRFYILGNSCISRRDKKTEHLLNSSNG